MSDCPCPPSDIQEPNWARMGVHADDIATASQYWREITNEMAQQQTLAEANRHMIIRLITARLIYEDAMEKVLRDGATVKYPTGAEGNSNWMNIANAQSKNIRQLEGDLGLVVTKRATASKGKVPGRGKKKPGGSDAIEF